MTLQTLLDNGSFFEGPRWHEGRWWVSDFYRHRVITVDPDGREEEVMHVEGQPSGLGWMPDGSLLVVSMHDQRILRRAADGTVTRARRRQRVLHRPPQRHGRRRHRPRLRRQLRLRPR